MIKLDEDRAIQACALTVALVALLFGVDLPKTSGAAPSEPLLARRPHALPAATLAAWHDAALACPLLATSTATLSERAFGSTRGAVVQFSRAGFERHAAVSAPSLDIPRAT